MKRMQDPHYLFKFRYLFNKAWIGFFFKIKQHTYRKINQWKTGRTVTKWTHLYNQRLKSKFNYCQHTQSFSSAPVSSLPLSWLFAHIIEIIQHLFFCVWLLLLNTVSRVSLLCYISQYKYATIDVFTFTVDRHLHTPM